MLGRFFQADPDLRILGCDLYLDPSESRPLAAISHGHSDHIGRHGRFIATPPTAAFLRLRLGDDLEGTILDYRKPLELDGFTVELVPAGHVLGSAMVRVSWNGESLLYTGDFRLRPSWTAEPAEVSHADALVMESTYGSPEWKFPSRDELGTRLHDLIEQIERRGRVPVVLAYSLGKAQEACWWLARQSMRVVVHPVIARINEIYAEHGVDLGTWEVWADQSALWGPRATSDLDGAVLVIPPHLTRELSRVRAETISLTGWALGERFRRSSDHAIPFSDHADFDELLELVDRVRPGVTYVTHGSGRFAKELRRRGYAAEILRHRAQMRLF